MPGASSLRRARDTLQNRWSIRLARDVRLGGAEALNDVGRDGLRAGARVRSRRGWRHGIDANQRSNVSERASRLDG